MRPPLGAIVRSQNHPLADVIGEVDRTAAGNIVLRVGQEVSPRNGWHQTAYVVLDPAEAEQLRDLIARALAGEERPA